MTGGRCGCLLAGGVACCTLQSGMLSVSVGGFLTSGEGPNEEPGPTGAAALVCPGAGTPMTTDRGFGADVVRLPGWSGVLGGAAMLLAPALVCFCNCCSNFERMLALGVSSGTAAVAAFRPGKLIGVGSVAGFGAAIGKPT